MTTTDITDDQTLAIPPHARAWAQIDPDEVAWEHHDDPITTAWIEPGYRADDGYYEAHYADAASGRKAAQTYASAYDPDEKTYWVRVRTWRQVVGLTSAGAVVYGHTDDLVRTVAIHPVEPPCIDHEGHDWRSPHAVVGGSRQSPGVFGHGAGVVERRVCARCGVYIDTDTWATDPATGEQGLHAIRYEDPDEASLAWVRARAAREDG